MEIVKDENLSRLAERTGKKSEDIERILFDELKDDLIERENYTVRECLNAYTPVSKIVGVLRKLGIDYIKSSDFELLENCIIKF